MEDAENKRFIYEFGRFVLDPKDRTLLENGKIIRLPAKEFETLLLLVENNGRALSKQEMIEAVWDDAFVEEGNLAKQISRLRKILNSNGEKIIETLPKHGYRFSAQVNQIYPPIEESILEKRTLKRMTVRVEEEFDDAPAALPPVKRSFSLSSLFAFVFLFLLFFSIVWLWSIKNSPAKINSMAVLPLRPLTEGENNKALGLGLTDALITKIGSLRSVAVRPTSAVVKFTDSDALETGRKLNVDVVLEGTIQEAEGRIRINARLLKVENGEQIWAENFDQPTSEIFTLQDALSNKIAQTFAFELNKSESSLLASRPTQNNAAYEKYLRGRFYQSQNNQQGLAKAIEFYEQAIALDSNFAEPYAGIADANTILYNFGLLSAAEALPKAKQNLNRAFQLNPNLPDAYNSLAMVQFLGEHNWSEAEKSLQKAIEIDPNNAVAFLRYGYFLLNVGEFDKALVKLEKAREFNPLSPIIQANIGLTYLCARRYPQAIQQLEKTTSENPELSLVHNFLGIAYEESGETEKAFASFLQALEAEGNADLAKNLRSIREKSGIEAANEFRLKELLKAQEAGQIPSLEIASRYAVLKNREQTLFWLEKASTEDERTFSSVKFLARYDFVREDERFQRIVKKIEFR